MPGLDGLRGLGMVAMLFFHSEFSWAQGGFLGLSLFFTLSGFLITSLLLAEYREYQRISLKAFWWRRFRRLAPAALLALAFVVLYGAFAATAAQREGLAGDVAAAVGYAANWRMLAVGHSYAALFTTPSPVQHFWSLAVEEQFYFIFPIITAAVFVATKGSRKAFAGVLGGLLAGSLVMELVSSGHDRIYYGTDTRAGEFIAGALLALWISSWRPRAVRRLETRIAFVGAGVALLLIPMWSRVALSSEWLYRGGFVGMGLLSCAVIAAAIVPGPVRTVCSFLPFRAVGLVSYGLYLYHWPVFLWLNGPRTGLGGWSLFFVRMSVTTALALASYFFVEQPIRTGQRLKRPRVFWSGIGALAGAVVIAVVAVVPVPRASQVIDASDFAAATKAFASGGRTVAPASGSTEGPDGVPKPLRVFVVGDSTGLLWAYGADAWGKQTGNMVVATDAFLDCPLARGGEFRHSADEPPGAVSDYCNTLPDYWPGSMDTFKPDVVVVMGGPSSLTDRRPAGSADWYSIGDPQWDSYFWSEINRDADLLRRPGVPILWFDQPYMQRDGGLSTGRLDEWSDPARADAYNRMVERLDRARADVTRFHWADYVNAMPLATFNHYSPDGVHFDAELIPSLMSDQHLWPKLRQAYVGAKQAMAGS
jgi:peptidoglycan/LPS O-acetylase OafA/YrhL